jgi:hypothetical protein
MAVPHRDAATLGFQLVKPKQLFIADGIVGVVIGVGLVVLPGLALSTLGIPPRDQARQLLVSFLGASLLANGGFQVLARDLAEGPAGLAFMRANLVFDLVGILLSLIGIFTGIVNFVGWGLVVLFAVIGAAHLWWGFLRPVGAPLED